MEWEKISYVCSMIVGSISGIFIVQTTGLSALLITGYVVGLYLGFKIGSKPWIDFKKNLLR